LNEGPRTFRRTFPFLPRSLTQGQSYRGKIYSDLRLRKIEIGKGHEKDPRS